MKKLIVLAACLSASTLALGQGAFNMNSKVSADGIDAPVMYDGMKVDGADGWVAQTAMRTTEAGPFTPIGEVVAFRSGKAAGYFSGGAVDTGLAAGTQVFLQVQAWNTADGATYADAEAAFGPIGASNVIGLNVTAPPDTPPNMVGLEGFSVAIVPEPSTMALGLLGIAALMLRRRR